MIERRDPLFARSERLKHVFSRECKNVILEEEANHDRTGRPVVCSQRAHQFVIEDDETESQLSLGSRSFLHRVNDQVRKRQKQSSIDATEDSEEHSVICGMFMSSTLQASVLMVKSYSDNWHSIKNKEDLTMKQMFDISEKLVSEQSDEIYRVKTIDWENSSWEYLSLIGDEQVISLSHTKVYVFSDSVLCLGKMNENHQSNMAWEDRLTWFKSSPEYRALDRIDGEPMEFEWNIFPRIQHIAALQQSSRVTVKIERNTREFYRTDHLHVDVQRHLMGIKGRVTENDENHFVKWGMFMNVTLESAVFMGKNCLNNCQSIANTTDLTMKQMFDISSKLVSE